MTTLQQIRDMRIAIVAFWSLWLTTLLLGGVLWTQKPYYETHPYYFDPAEYCLEGAKLYQKLPAAGRWHLAWNEWVNNNTHPLQTAVRVLFCPETFRYPYGHLSVTTPILAASLFVLAWTLFQRTGSLPYACAVTALFCALPQFQDPYWGLGAYWLDPPAALLSGSAMLCLMNVKGSRSTSWLVAFSIFAALAALHRYIAVIYTLVVCGPILAWRLVQLSRLHGLIKGGLLPLAAASLPGVLLAGPHLVMHFHFHIVGYTAVGYALGHSMKDSYLSNAYLFRTFLFSHPFFPWCLAGLFVLSLCFLWRQNMPHWDSLLISLWLVSAVLLFQIFVLRAVQAPHVLIYAVPGLFFAFVSPAPILVNSRRLMTVVSCIIGSIAVIFGTSLHAEAMRSAYELKARHEKKFYNSVAEHLIRLGGARVSWAALFDECAPLPALEVFYRTGMLPVSEDILCSLSVHESYYKSRFPNTDPAGVCQKVYGRLCATKQIVLAFDNPAAVDRAGFDNEYTKSVARFVAQKVHSDSTVWQWVFSLRHERFGLISGYKNLSFNGSNPQ